MDIESVVKQVPHDECSEICSARVIDDAVHTECGHPAPNCVRCALESYAASQREMRKGLGKAWQDLKDRYSECPYCDSAWSEHALEDCPYKALSTILEGKG